MKSDIAEAFSQIVKEKNIDKDELTMMVENIILLMIKKKYGTTDNFDIFVHLDKGEIEIYQNKTIVEHVQDENLEINLEAAQAFEPDLEIGDEFVEIVDPASFGRRLIISAKQNLNQKLRDLEKESIFEEYKNRIGEIIMGDIRQINRDEIYVNVDRAEMVLPKEEQIHNERYHRGEHIRAVIKEVIRTNRGPEIVISRANPMFLLRLFELEVPEIYDGIIEVKAIAREPGERTKIAVYSNDARIDAVGACVGMKGIRIQSIVKELNNEKIDIINWNAEPEIFIARALSPAKSSRVIINEENKTATVVLPNDQISLAIGRGGQNRRLASRLTTYEIETVKESDYLKIDAEDEQEDQDLNKLEGISKSIIKKLLSAGFETLAEIKSAGEKGLLEVPGIGEKTAQKILELVDNTEELEERE
ncbi:transcription termination factor NusA [candidate division KSB1 bacterium]|nr:transcription termination factor NusA [candidate division KSB1 bacterium]